MSNRDKELPKRLGWGYTTENLTRALPYDAFSAGMELISYTPSRAADPVCLYDSLGHIVFQWPENYIPSLGEVMETSMNFLKQSK